MLSDQTPNTEAAAAMERLLAGGGSPWARRKLCDAFERPWYELTQTVRTGDNAFNHLFGTDVWTYRSTHPDFSSLFNVAMQSLTQGTDAAIGMEYPFGEFGWIVDIGGGNGSLLLPILERHPAMRGTIVELPHVAAQTRERLSAAGLAARCDAIVGDARTTNLPAGADAYVLKLVIHGKTDDEAVAILRNWAAPPCRRMPGC